MKFKVGDKVYLDKRGKFGNDRNDYSLIDGLVKNKIYTVLIITVYNRVILENQNYNFHENHFKKYEV